MMKKTFLILLVLLISKNLFAQEDGPRDMPDGITNPSWEFYSDNMLSSVSAGKGYTGIASSGDLSSLSLNPASIYVDKKYSFHIGSSYKSSINSPFLSSYSLKNTFPSCIIGGLYRINKNFQVGMVYRNDYGFLNESENDDGGNHNLRYKLITHNISVPVTYNNEWIRAGVNLNLIYFRGEFNGYITTETQPEGYYDEVHSSLCRFLPQFGVIINPIKSFSFGVSLTPGFIDSTTWYYNVITPSQINSLVRYPWRIGIGTELRLLKERLKLSLDYHFEKTSINNNAKNKSNFNIGAEYQMEDYFIIRCGFFTLLDFRDLSNTIIVEDENNSYDQYFITLGGTYKYKGYSFSLALMDSHLTKKTDVYHTKINGGISLDF